MLRSQYCPVPILPELDVRDEIRPNAGNRRSGLPVSAYQLSGQERQLTNSPGSTGQEERTEVSDLDALADDLRLLLKQIPDVTLAMENSVSALALGLLVY